MVQGGKLAGEALLAETFLFWNSWQEQLEETQDFAAPCVHSRHSSLHAMGSAGAGQLCSALAPAAGIPDFKRDQVFGWMQISKLVLTLSLPAFSVLLTKTQSEPSLSCRGTVSSQAVFCMALSNCVPDWKELSVGACLADMRLQFGFLASWVVQIRMSFVWEFALWA